MIRRPPRSTRTDTLFPYTTLFRSAKLSPLRLSSRPSDRRFPLLEERAPGTVVGPGARRRHRPLYLFSSSHAGKVRAGEDPSLPARPRGCEKGNEVCAFAGIFDAGIAHAGARHGAPRIGQETVEAFPVPTEAGLAQGRPLAPEAVDGAGRAADEAAVLRP